MQAAIDGVVWELGPDQAPPKMRLLKSGVRVSAQDGMCASARHLAPADQCASPRSKARSH